MTIQLSFLLIIPLFLRDIYGVKLCVECDTDSWSLKKGCLTVSCDKNDPEGFCYDCPETHTKYKDEEKRKCWKCYGKGCEEGLYHRIKCPSNKDPGYCIDCSGLEDLSKDCWTCYVNPPQFCQAVSCKFKDEDGTCYKNCDYGVPGNSKPPVFFSRNDEDSSSQSYEYSYDDDEPSTDPVLLPRKVLSENISRVQQKKGFKFHYTHIPHSKSKHFYFGPSYQSTSFDGKRSMSFKNLLRIINNSSSSNTCLHCSKNNHPLEGCKPMSCKSHLHSHYALMEKFLSNFKKEEIPLSLNMSLSKNLTHLHDDMRGKRSSFGRCYQCLDNDTAEIFKDRRDCKLMACSENVTDLYRALYPQIDPQEFINKLNDTEFVLRSLTSGNFGGEDACYQCQGNETPIGGKCDEMSCSGKLKKDLNSACFRDHIKVPCGVDCLSCSRGVQSVCNFVPCRPGDEVMTCYGVCKDWQSV